VVSQQLPQKLVEVVCCLWIENLDSKEHHQFGSNCQQEKAPNGALKKATHGHKL